MIFISEIEERVHFDPDDEVSFEEAEFINEDTPVDFRELVRYMREFTLPSCWPARGSTFEWLSTHGEQDYQDGAQVHRTLHYSQKNPARNAKYWKKAMAVAGIIKG